MPVHVKAGVISEILGFDDLMNNINVHRVVPVHFLRDKIENWGSAQQVFAYLHIIGKNREEIESIIDKILSGLSIKDEKGNEMLFNLYRESK